VSGFDVTMALVPSWAPLRPPAAFVAAETFERFCGVPPRD